MENTYSRNIIYSIVCTMVAVILALPYIYYMVAYSTPGGMLVEVDFSWVTFMQEVVEVVGVIFISCMIGFTWSKSEGLAGLGTVLDIKHNWQRIVVYGMFVGLVVYIFGDRYFMKIAPGFYPRELRFAIFIPFYAALVEEIFTRFGTMTLLVKIFKQKQVANVLAALIFAIGHVNMFQVAGIIYRLNYITFCSFVLNLGISLFFGYIYWRKGLLTAMGIHFIANLRYVVIAFFT